MLYSKLIDIIAVLDAKELKLLRKFVYSPVYNLHKEVCKLFDYVAGLKQYTEKNLDKKLVYKQIFQNSKYNDLRLRHVVSYLLRVCENCLEYIESQQEESQYKLNLLRAYHKRNLSKHFKNEFDTHKKTLLGSDPQSGFSAFHSYQLNLVSFAAESSDISKKLEYLQAADKSLSTYFMICKLKNACQFLNLQKGEGYTPLLLSEIKAALSTQNSIAVPELDVYCHALLAFQNQDETNFYFTFKDKLVQHASLLPEQELKDLFDLAIRYCKNKQEEGNLNFDKELFELFLHGLANNALLDKQTLSIETHTNIVVTGLVVNEISWVEDFIQESLHLLDELHRDDLFHLNTARLCFAKLNNEAGIQILAKLKPKNQYLLKEHKALKTKAQHLLRVELSSETAV
jgi:hypothetical protein